MKAQEKARETSESLRLNFVRDIMKIELAVGDAFSGCEKEGEVFERIFPVHPCQGEVETSAGIYDEAQQLPLHIKSFAPRENKGVQPVGDDVVVDVKWKEKVNVVTMSACNVFWNPEQCLSVGVWKPNYAALLKMQNEYDKKESEMISEKEMKIVEAVCYFENVEMRGAGLITTPTKENTDHKECEVYCAFTGELDEIHHHWRVFCTVEEFSQCIEEMAAAKWMRGYKMCYGRYMSDCVAEGIDTSNKCLQKEASEQPIYTKAMQDAGEVPSVGMVCSFAMDSELFLFKGYEVTYISNYGVVLKCPDTFVETFIGDIHRVKFIAIETRTPEEIEAEELEEAKVKQVDDYVRMYNLNRVAAKLMQESGHLAEIILPLKG